MIESIEALILSGGKGTRLSTVVTDLPKPMAPISDRPFLEYLIDSLKEQGIRKVCFLTGHLGQKIQSHFGSGENFGLQIRYSEEETPLGTGGAVKKALIESTGENFLVFNGDSLFEGDLNYFLKFSEGKDSIALRYCSNRSRYGSVEIDDQFLVTSFREKENSELDGYMSAGIYFLSRNSLNEFPTEESFSIETAVLPRLAKARRLKGIPLGGKFIDIGIPEDFYKAQTFLTDFKFSGRNPALFLDRDGILVKDVKYLSHKKDIQVNLELVPVIKEMNQLKIPVIVITNQAGIAKEKFSVNDYLEVNAEIELQFKNLGVNISKTYYCPFHPTAGSPEWIRNSLLRKPKPGMILLAQEDFSIDIEHSLMVGDKDSDRIELLGLKSVVVQGDYELDKKRNGILSSFQELQLLCNRYFHKYSASRSSKKIDRVVNTNLE